MNENAAQLEMAIKVIAGMREEEREAFYNKLRESGVFTEEDINLIQMRVGYFRILTEKRYHDRMMAATLEMYKANI